MEYSFEDFTKYKRYLNTINEVLKGYFENQKEYICCQKGCAYCCENGQYPLSQLEFNYLLLGFFKLDMKVQQGVIKRIPDKMSNQLTANNNGEYSFISFRLIN